ncbi:MAG: hypothetical protein OXF86_18670, partial [Caldilineaceae bacterium]|nr:hypothetical protein [Caldilineaceae bacterium]
MFSVFGRDAVQASGLAVRWGPSVGASARAGTKAGTYGDLMGLPDVVWLNPFDMAPVTNRDTRSARHVVGEGALRGRS